jgi:NAD-dependent deacetylase
MMEPIERLREIVETSDRIVAFTGAGLSAESGIPTYRGAGGLWTKYDPDIYADIGQFLRDPTYYWNFFQEVRYPVISKARPNPAHDAIVELERRKLLSAVITQNIDGLHQMAGSRNVIELHGNTRSIACMECGRKHTMDEVFEKLPEELPPKCECGGGLRPEVVFFGEPLPVDALEDADRAVRDCDACIVIGSSLVVHPAAMLPVVAVDNGASLSIINIDPTPLDHLADVVINESAADVLYTVVKGGFE